MTGHAAIPALDHMLDELEQQRLTLARQLDILPATSGPVATPPLNGGLLRSAITAVRTMLSTREDAFDESWISIARQLVQKVVIAPSADGKSAELTIHGRLAAILAAQEAWREVSRELRVSNRRSTSACVQRARSSRWPTKQNSFAAARPCCRAGEGMAAITSLSGCGGRI
ncbi:MULTISPECIES: hypothetical protein [Sinorhizobium]|uniref:hypothetical protein n=1 Tax=Sinorhizobium TaxID=28105 RepID=UPI001142932B|nr:MULTISPECIES: hypothetical protein [Sinorhizobium]